MNADLIKRTTATELVGVWRQAVADITTAFNLIHAAEERAKAAFLTDYRMDVQRALEKTHCGFGKPQEALEWMQREAWTAIIERLDIRKLMSQARRNEVDRQLESGQGMPPLTEANVIALVEAEFAKLGEYRDEAVKEVFERLRPRHSKYKTNSEFEVGRKVIIGYAVENNYRNGYRVNHRYSGELTGLDNVFHFLDGKGVVKSTHGPLVDAISKATHAENSGETDYFRFKCFRNQNLHIEFKRLDLLAEFNRIGGGNRLKTDNTARSHRTCRCPSCGRQWPVEKTNEHGQCEVCTGAVSPLT